MYRSSRTNLGQLTNDVRRDLTAFTTAARKDKRVRTFGLVAAGLFLLVATVATATMVFLPSWQWGEAWLALDTDGSATEWFGYALALTTALYLTLAYRRSGLVIYLAFAALFVFIFLDDAFGYHEAFGRNLRARVDLPRILDLRRQDVGEMIGWGVAGLIIAIPFAASLVTPGRGKGSVLFLMGSLFAALATFAIGFDMLHILADGRMKTLLGLVEDGGELFVLASAAVAAFALSRHPIGTRPKAIRLRRGGGDEPVRGTSRQPYPHAFAQREDSTA